MEEQDEGKEETGKTGDSKLVVRVGGSSELKEEERVLGQWTLDTGILPESPTEAGGGCGDHKRDESQHSKVPHTRQVYLQNQYTTV